MGYLGGFLRTNVAVKERLQKSENLRKRWEGIKEICWRAKAAAVEASSGQVRELGEQRERASGRYTVFG